MSISIATAQRGDHGGIDLRGLLAGLGTTMRFRAGDAVFREGDSPSFMYVVMSGAVEIRTHDRVIELLGPQDSLGVVALIDGQPRTATAVAVADSELAAIDQQRFKFMVEETPNFGWYVMHELTRRLRATNAAL